MDDSDLDRESEPLLQPGSKVHHPTYGNGTITDVWREEDILNVAVEFETPEGLVTDITHLQRGDLAEGRSGDLRAGWDDAEEGKIVSPQARELKRRLFGSDLTVD